MVIAATAKVQFTKEQRLKRVLRRATLVLFESWEEDWRHSRILDAPLIPDELILAGFSRQGSVHREHVVPLALIRDQCEEMFRTGADLSVVADFLERHLKIVMISRDEQIRLDGECGLRTRMPEGWSFNDENADVFERLKAAGIEWDNEIPAFKAT